MTALATYMPLMSVLHGECRNLHRGRIAEDMKVVHKNGIGVDCRLDNLAIVESSARSHPQLHVNIETSVYWRALRNIYFNSIVELSVSLELFVSVDYTAVVVTALC